MIRVICERPEYMPRMKDTIEEMLKPLYVFMTDPMKITFEDDIVMNMKQFVRKNKAVSATQWEILM